MLLRPRAARPIPDAAAEVAATCSATCRAGAIMLIEALHLIQDKYRCLAPAHLVALADEFRLAMVRSI